jgi:hypothetical protein
MDTHRIDDGIAADMDTTKADGAHGLDMSRMMVDLLQSADISHEKLSELAPLIPIQEPAVNAKDDDNLQNKEISQQVSQLKNDESGIWIGTEYRYILTNEKLTFKLIFLANPEFLSFASSNNLVIKITLIDGIKNKTRRLYLGSLTGDGNTSQEISFKSISYIRSMEMNVKK